MLKTMLNSYEKELRNAQGKRWYCQACKTKNVMLNKTTSLGTALSTFFKKGKGLYNK